jgi:hypothetical protein
VVRIAHDLPLSYRPTDRIRFDAQANHCPANTGDCYTVAFSRYSGLAVCVKEIGYCFTYLAGLAGGHYSPFTLAMAAAAIASGSPIDGCR